jgi:hypothetical protein
MEACILQQTYSFVFGMHLLPMTGVPQFSLSQLNAATNEFSEGCVVERGYYKVVAWLASFALCSSDNDCHQWAFVFVKTSALQIV